MEQRELTTQPIADKAEEQQRRRRRNKSEHRTSRESNSFPWYAKALISLGLLLVSLVAGLIVGYSVVGDGSAADALDFGTYKHIYDLVFKP